jgi:hypothetical protein
MFMHYYVNRGSRKCSFRVGWLSMKVAKGKPHTKLNREFTKAPNSVGKVIRNGPIMRRRGTGRGAGAVGRPRIGWNSLLWQNMHVAPTDCLLGDAG